MTLSPAWIPAAPLAMMAAGAIAAFAAGRARGARAGDAIAAVALAAVLALDVAWIAPRAASAESVALLGEARFRADGVAAILIALASALGAAVSAHHAISREPGPRDRGALVALLSAGVTGVGLARDLFDLYVFFELMAVASFALVALGAGERATRQAMRYLALNGAGALLALSGIGLSYLATGSLAVGAPPLSTTPGTLAGVAAGLLVVGFGVKAALAPLHLWLPGTYAEAPAGVSALLGGVVTATGAFALAKAVSGFAAHEPAPYLGALLVALALATMTIGNLSALRARDAKRLLAYSSLAHGGYVLLALALGLSFGLQVALLAASFHALAHGLLKGGAFLAVGAFERARGSRDIEALRGAGRAAPAAGLALALLVLGLVGVPPTVGFLGKVLLAGAAVAREDLWGVAVLAAFGANVLLSLAYYVPFATRILLEPPPAIPDGGWRSDDERQSSSGPVVPLRVAAPALALALAALALGLAPGGLVALAESAAAALAGGVP